MIGFSPWVLSAGLKSSLRCLYSLTLRLVRGHSAPCFTVVTFLLVLHVVQSLPFDAYMLCGTSWTIYQLNPFPLYMVQKGPNLAQAHPGCSPSTLIITASRYFIKGFLPVTTHVTLKLQETWEVIYLISLYGQRNGIQEHLKDLPTLTILLSSTKTL